MFAYSWFGLFICYTFPLQNSSFKKVQYWAWTRLVDFVIHGKEFPSVLCLSASYCKCSASIRFRMRSKLIELLGAVAESFVIGSVWELSSRQPRAGISYPFRSCTLQGEEFS